MNQEYEVEWGKGYQPEKKVVKLDFFLDYLEKGYDVRIPYMVSQLRVGEFFGGFDTNGEQTIRRIK